MARKLAKQGVVSLSVSNLDVHRDKRLSRRHLRKTIDNLGGGPSNWTVGGDLDGLAFPWSREDADAMDSQEAPAPLPQTGGQELACRPEN